MVSTEDKRGILTAVTLWVSMMIWALPIQAQTTIPFSQLIEDRFTIECLSASTEVCEERSCEVIEECATTDITAQVAEVESILTSITTSITVEEEDGVYR